MLNLPLKVYSTENEASFQNFPDKSQILGTRLWKKKVKH